MKRRFEREAFSFLPFCFYFNRSVGGGDAAAMCVRAPRHRLPTKRGLLSSPLGSIPSPADRDFRGYNNGRTTLNAVDRLSDRAAADP